MNIIVTLNRNYIPPLTVMMTSLLQNNSGVFVSFYILHSSLQEEDFFYIQQHVPFTNYRVVGTEVPHGFMEDAPVLFHYTKEMYYRIFAAELLPPDVDKALYLDPDMIIINPLDILYNMELGDNLFAAAKSPNPLTQKRFIKRLGMPEDAEYFNSGVLLMNLAKLRERDDHAAIAQYIEENGDILLLPDQDILNVFYNSNTIILDSNIYNFDARYYRVLSMLPPISQDENWIDENTIVIHYCGKNKPWHKKYQGVLGKYYREYQKLCETLSKQPKTPDKQ
ncbi:MAG: glycosyltransferase family 8 protein [Angelakisella sp.]